MRRWVGVALCCLFLTACGTTRARVRIGVQPFAGQAIMSQILRGLIEDHTRLRPVMLPCADTYDCLQAMNQQRLDLVVDHDVDGRFSNTAVVSGASPLPSLTRLDSFQFESGYLLVMPTDRAVALGISSIAELTTLKDGMRLAIPADYLRQARIGPYELMRRYGLRLRGDLQIISEPEKRLRALFGGQVDVSVVRSDSGLIGAAPITVLEDPLGFFPPSQAAITVRSTFLQTHPKLPESLMTLQSHLAQATIRQLSYEVQVEGRTPEIVAHRFLRQAQLISDRPTSISRQPEILIAVHPQDHFGVFAPLAVRAVREVYRGQPARLAATETLVRDVVYGRARLALLGAERFFQAGGASRFGVREERLEAVGVAGSRFLHIVRRRGEADGAASLAGRLGLPPRGSGSAKVVVALLESLNAEPTVFTDINGLLDQVVSGQLDAALFFLVPGANEIAQRLAEDRLEIRSLPRISATLPPFARPVRIPKATYAGQTEPIESVAIQVVIAGPAPQPGKTLRSGGLPGALPSQSQPVTTEQAQRLASFFLSAEAPDPSLPSIWIRELQGAFDRDPQIGWAVLDTILSVFAGLFLLWAAALALRWPRRS